MHCESAGLMLIFFAFEMYIFEEPLYEPRCEKTSLRGFRPGQIQTGLYIHRRWLEA